MTKAALTQHRKDAHGMGQQAPVSRKTNAVPRQRKRPTRGYSAPVAVPSVVRGGGTDLARMSGTDRVYHGTVSVQTSGAKLCDLLVTPSMFSRLATVAKAYQRIRYTRLDFVIETQMSTATSGGYVAGFVRDPADVVDTLNQLMAQDGAIATKWWQSATIAATPPTRLYYTSESAEIREYSPGRLVFMVDGRSSQNGSFTIYARWAVELTGAGLENPKQVDAVWSAPNNWYTRPNHQGFWDGTGANATSRAEMLVGSGWKVGMQFKLPHAIPFIQSTGTMRLTHWAYIYDANTVLPCFESPVDFDKNVSSVETLFLLKGSTLDDVTPALVQGEAQPPSSSDSLTVMAELLQQLLRCSNVPEIASRLSEELKNSSEKS